MFKNPGKKLKTVAHVFFIVDCIAAALSFFGSLIYVLVMLVEAVKYDSVAMVGAALLYAFIFFLSLLAALFFSWLGALFLYGFGQLIESAQNTEKLLRNEPQENASPSPEIYNAYPEQPIPDLSDADGYQDIDPDAIYYPPVQSE